MLVSLVYFNLMPSKYPMGTPRHSWHLKVLLICCGQLFMWINRVLSSLPSLSLSTDRKADSSRPRKWSHQPPPSPSVSPSLPLSLPPCPVLSFLSLSLFFLNRHIPLFFKWKQALLLGSGFSLNSNNHTLAEYMSGSNRGEPTNFSKD